MTILLEIAVVAAIVFAVVAYTLGHFESMRPAPPESGTIGLPDGPVEAAAVDQTRFGLSFRGYRMDEVDAVLDRLRDELARRDGSGETAPDTGDTAVSREGAAARSGPVTADPAAADAHPAVPGSARPPAADTHPPAGAATEEASDGSPGGGSATETDPPTVPQHQPGADEAPAGDPEGPWPS